jgi:IS30 family transposase
MTKMELNKIDEKLLMKIQEKLNNRPRKIIGFKTPQEIMNSELKNIA